MSLKFCCWQVFLRVYFFLISLLGRQRNIWFTNYGASNGKYWSTLGIAAIAFESQHFLPNMHIARKHYLSCKLQNKQLLKVAVGRKVTARFNVGFTYLFKHFPYSFLFAIIYLLNYFSMFWLSVAHFLIRFNLLYFHLYDSFIYYSLLV